MRDGFSFIHAADLHLDSPFRGFEQVHFADGETRDNVLRQLRDCTFTALDNLVEACIEHRVDFVVLAGDIYDLADRSLRAQLRFRDALERLAAAGIPVFVAHGNHDHDEGWRASLDWPENTWFFAPGRVEARPVVKGGAEIARVYGISYPCREVTENYAALFRRDPGAPFAVAVLHGNVGGWSEHANYAPCSVEDLVGSGFDYWALGHVHRRAVLREHGPCVVYPGSLQGRNPRETGPKGCWLVQVGPGGDITLRFLAVDSVRWERLAVPVDGLDTEQELLDRLDREMERLKERHAGRSVVARLELTGRGPLHGRLRHDGTLEDLLDELRHRHAGPAGTFVWPESIRRRTAPAVDKEALRASRTLLGDLLAVSREARGGGEARRVLQQMLAPLHHRLARYAGVPGEEEFDALLEAAEDLALDLLWEEDAT